MDTKKKNWSGMLILAIGLVLVIGVIISILFSIMNYNMMKELVAIQEGDVTQETKEDGVVIMNEYKIESTLPISDAYKSGDTSKLDDRQKETLDMASEVLNEIIKKDMTDFEKERAVYDWMCANIGGDSGVLTVIPSSGKDSDNPYGVLKYNNAVCVGYATTFRLFMQMMDIDCMVVHNSDLTHTWDLVKLDEHWYHTDIYSDSGSGDYENFNMNDVMFDQRNTWDMTFFPDADALTYNMAYQNIKTIKDVKDLPETIRACLEDGVTSMMFKMDKNPDEKTMEEANYIMDLLGDNYLNLDKASAYLNYFGWMNDDEDQSVMLYVDVEETKLDSSQDDLDDETKDKLYDLFNKSFSDILGDDEME